MPMRLAERSPSSTNSSLANSRQAGARKRPRLDHMQVEGSNTSKPEAPGLSDFRKIERLVKAGRDQDALLACDQALAGVDRTRYPKDAAELFISRSEIHERLGDLNASLLAAKAAIRASPDLPAPYMRAATALHAAGHQAKALNSLKAARSRCNYPMDALALEQIEAMEAKYRPVLLERLPRDIFFMILSYLPTKDVLRTLSVSRLWRSEALAHPRLWRHLDISCIGSSMNAAKTYAKMLRVARRFNDLSHSRIESINIASKASGTDGLDALLDVVAPNCTTLCSLTASINQLPALADKVLPHCGKLQTLVLDTYGGPVPPKTFDLSTGALGRCLLHKLSCSEPHVLEWNKGLLAMLRELRHLQLGNDDSASTVGIGLDVHQILLNSRATLETVYFQWVSWFAPPVNVGDIDRDTVLEFPRLTTLFGWKYPRSHLIQPQAFRFPVLKHASVTLYNAREEESFFQSSPNLTWLRIRRETLFEMPPALERTGMHLALLPHLEGLQWECAIFGVSPSGMIDLLANSTTCPNLETLSIVSATQMSGGELVRLVAVRKYVSAGYTLQEARRKARCPPSASIITEHAEEVRCKPIRSLTVAIEGIDPEALAFLRKHVPEFNYISRSS